MRTQFAAIIFDMDGLLVNSEIVWHAAETELLTSRGIVYTEEARSAIVGLRVDEFLAYLKDYYALPDSLQTLVDELNNRMLTLIPTEVLPQPGAEALLAYVVEQSIPRAIASNSSLAIINTTVEGCGWGDLIPVRCSADDEAHGKPAPDVYLTAARRLGVNPADCLALEDSVNGAKAVVAAGMTCFAVPDPSHATPALFADITPHVFASLDDVLAVLRGV
ncbi:MAG: HAD family phosphatase [Armatimonadetes bacterium]|nr:HAD family phosphatase [Anaerolineae bacterium]